MFYIYDNVKANKIYDKKESPWSNENTLAGPLNKILTPTRIELTHNIKKTFIQYQQKKCFSKRYLLIINTVGYQLLLNEIAFIIAH